MNRRMVAVSALVAAAGCGGTPRASGDGGSDAGVSALADAAARSSDGAAVDEASLDAAPADAAAMDAAPADAAAIDGASSVAVGTATLGGSGAFPVRWAWMDPAEPSAQCGAVAVQDGGIAATSIFLFENDESALACVDGGLNAGGTGRFIDIGVGTAQYVSEVSPPTVALSPGTYTILNEGENDEDLCSERLDTPTSILQVLQYGLYDAQQIAVSGTVTIDRVDATSIAGSFDVVLGGPYGQVDGGTSTLSGSFSAAACP